MVYCGNTPKFCLKTYLFNTKQFVKYGSTPQSLIPLSDSKLWKHTQWSFNLPLQYQIAYLIAEMHPVVQCIHIIVEIRPMFRHHFQIQKLWKNTLLSHVSSKLKVMDLYLHGPMTQFVEYLMVPQFSLSFVLKSPFAQSHTKVNSCWSKIQKKFAINLLNHEGKLLYSTTNVTLTGLKFKREFSINLMNMGIDCSILPLAHDYDIKII